MGQGVGPGIQFVVIQGLIDMYVSDEDTRVVVLGQNHGLHILHHHLFKFFPAYAWPQPGISENTRSPISSQRSRKYSDCI